MRIATETRAGEGCSWSRTRWVAASAVYLLSAVVLIAVSTAGPGLASAAPSSRNTRARASGPRYYFVVGPVTTEGSQDPRLLEELRQLFADELRRRPEVTVEPPAGLPSEPDAMKEALTRQGLRAFDASIKLLALEEQVLPPKPGHQYRVLERAIRLSIFGNTVPDKVLAIGGDGEARVGQEIGRNADLERESRALFREAAQAALKQAVDMTLTKMQLAESAGQTRQRRRR